jgi:hypothetical protein
MLIGALAATAALGSPLDPALQPKVDAQLRAIVALAADPVVVGAVKAHNASLTAAEAAMTQDAWKALTVLDPFVRSFAKSPAGAWLKAKKGDAVSEAFLSGADGIKVAFLSKPTNWSHKGKPKHDVPMSGKTWQGTPETDDSSGQLQVQVAVPVLDGGKPIGSLVVGLQLSKL